MSVFEDTNPRALKELLAEIHHTMDSVLNGTLMDRTTNQMISDRAPSGHLAGIGGTPGLPFDAMLASTRVPTGHAPPFCAGLAEAADLEAEET